MAEYLHHVPGRLRVRSRVLRSDSPARRAALRELGRNPGIHSVRLNAKAGSVTVVYDRNTLNMDSIVEHLKAYDCWAVPARATGPGPAAAPRTAAVGPGAPSAVGAAASTDLQVLPAMVGKAALTLLVNKGVSASLSSLLRTRV
jgi:hypothetical protein